MWVASLVLCASLVGQTGSADPSELAARLGASRFAERESAESALEQLGRRAVPALRSASTAKDAEVRTRALALLNRIEGGLMTRATSVKLDVSGVPLREAVASIREQTGIKLVLVPENARSWQTRRVTLRERDDVPFWTALDLLCRAAHLNYNLANGSTTGRGQTQGQTISLFDSNLVPTAPTYDSGPFRVTLTGLHYQRDVMFAPVPFAPGGDAAARALPGEGGAARTSESFSVQFQVTAEPRLNVSQVGPLKVLEAADDRGQSLLPEGQGRGVMTPRNSGYFGFTNSPTLVAQAALRRPPEPGKSIRKFKATLPLSVSTRKPNPLTIPLDEPPGKTYRNDQAELTVHEVRLKPNDRPAVIEIAVRSQPDQNAPSDPTRPLPFGQPDGPQQIEVVDGAGESVPCFVSRVNPESARMTITVTPRNALVPKELRYYGVARAATEMTFEFRDVPIP